MRGSIIHNYRIILTASFAMFAMFFGAGNLVFPLDLGARIVKNGLFAAMGLLLTGIAVPFMGLIAIVMCQGNRARFFDVIGHRSALLITFAMLALLGPFGAVPRCITVAYGGFSLVFPDCPYVLFSALFCLFNLIIIWRHDKIVSIIGTLLTPWLLIALTILIVAGLMHEVPVNNTLPPISELSALGEGFLQGYHTMDLLAAFFFSATTVEYLNNHLRAKRASHQLIPVSIVTSFVGAGILALSYLGFIKLGSHYSSMLESIAPEQRLVAIAQVSMSSIAAPVVAITILVACLTTISILTTLFAEFFSAELLKGRLKRKSSIIITLLAAFIVSLLGFSGISYFLSYLLQVLYPALIALVFAHLLSGWTTRHYGQIAFRSTACISSLFQLWLILS